MESNKTSLDSLLLQIKPQKFLSEFEFINKDHQKKLETININNNNDLKRIKSNSSKFAGAWLTALPISGLGLTMKSKEYSTALKLRLGLNIYPRNSTCKFCKQFNDQYGYHAIKCSEANNRNNRHDIVRDVWNKICTEAQLPTDSELPGLIAENNNRPGDIVIKISMKILYVSTLRLLTFMMEFP